MAWFAIEQGNAGATPGYRAIQPGWDLAPHEAFSVELADGDSPRNYVYDDAGTGLRAQSDEEAAEQDAVPLLDEINALRDVISESEFLHDELWYSCNHTSKLDILGIEADVRSGLPIDLPIQFITSDNELVEFETGEAFTKLGRALRAHRTAAVFNAVRLKQLVAAGQPIDITVGWPANRIL